MRGWWGFGVEGQTAWCILTSKLPCHSLSHHKRVPSALRGVGSITLVAKCPWLILHELQMLFRAAMIFFFHLSGVKSTTIEPCSDNRWPVQCWRSPIGFPVWHNKALQCKIHFRKEMELNISTSHFPHIFEHPPLWYFFLSFPGITKKIILYKSKSQS